MCEQTNKAFLADCSIRLQNIMKKLYSSAKKGNGQDYFDAKHDFEVLQGDFREFESFSDNASGDLQYFDGILKKTNEIFSKANLESYI